jgi:hypothetical protein
MTAGERKRIDARIQNSPFADVACSDIGTYNWESMEVQDATEDFESLHDCRAFPANRRFVLSVSYYLHNHKRLAEDSNEDIRTAETLYCTCICS